MKFNVTCHWFPRAQGRRAWLAFFRQQASIGYMRTHTTNFEFSLHRTWLSKKSEPTFLVMMGELLIRTRQSNWCCSYSLYQREITFDKTEFHSCWPLVSRKLIYLKSQPAEYHHHTQYLKHTLNEFGLRGPSSSQQVSTPNEVSHSTTSSLILPTHVSADRAHFSGSSDTCHTRRFTSPLPEGLSVLPATSRLTQLTYSRQCLKQQNYPTLSSEQ